MKKLERVLVKEVNWLGDMVMSLPALKALRRAFPGAHLAVLVRRELAGFFDGSRWIDEVIPYVHASGLQRLRGLQRVVSETRRRRFDLAVLLSRSFEAALLPALAGVPRRAGFVADGRGWLLTDKAHLTPELRASHQVHEYLAMIEQSLGIAGRPDDFAPDVHEPLRSQVGSWLAARRRRPGAPLIALGVAAAYGPAKVWPMRHYADLIALLAARHGAECVLIGSPAERQWCEAVAAATPHRTLIAAGETSVGAAIALLSLCAGFAGNDSGAMHIAGALGIPTVGIFGSTNPGRTGPFGPKSRVVSRPIACAPCLQRHCRFGHYECLEAVTAADVIDALAAAGALGNRSCTCRPSRRHLPCVGSCGRQGGHWRPPHKT